VRAQLFEQNTLVSSLMRIANSIKLKKVRVACVALCARVSWTRSHAPAPHS
jgi:hypothetical protein